MVGWSVVKEGGDRRDDRVGEVEGGDRVVEVGVVGEEEIRGEEGT